MATDTLETPRKKAAKTATIKPSTTKPVTAKKAAAKKPRAKKASASKKGTQTHAAPVTAGSASLRRESLAVVLLLAKQRQTLRVLVLHR